MYDNKFLKTGKSDSFYFNFLNSGKWGLFFQEGQ